MILQFEVVLNDTDPETDLLKIYTDVVTLTNNLDYCIKTIHGYFSLQLD